MAGGKVIVLIGRRRTGKTTFSRNLLEKNKSIEKKIYDINQEYRDMYNHDFIDFEKFLQEAVELKNHYILFEEATIFFDTRSSFSEMKNLLVRARHTSNIIQLNFHSFKSVPKNIYNLTDYVVVFKTNDTLKDVKEKFDHDGVLSAYNDAIKSDNEFFNRTVSLY